MTGKGTSITLLSVAAVAWVGYVFRVEIMLTAISIVSDQRTPVGEHQTIAWQAGPTEPQDTSDKPNIVLLRQKADPENDAYIYWSN